MVETAGLPVPPVAGPSNPTPTPTTPAQPTSNGTNDNAAPSTPASLPPRATPTPGNLDEERKLELVRGMDPAKIEQARKVGRMDACSGIGLLMTLIAFAGAQECRDEQGELVRVLQADHRA